MASFDRNEWQTPPELFTVLDYYYSFEVDAAASPDNALCSCYITKEQNSLKEPWHGRVFCNPPYGQKSAKTGCAGILAWAEHAVSNCCCGIADLVCLVVPDDTSTEHYQIALNRAAVIYQLGRVKFIGPGDAPIQRINLYIFTDWSVRTYDKAQILWKDWESEFDILANRLGMFGGLEDDEGDD